MPANNQRPKSNRTSNSNVRLNIELMRQLAQERGGRCLSATYVNTDTHLDWECANKHRWRAVPNSIRRGSWCRICAYANQLRTLEEMQALARRHGGVCLSTHYHSNENPLEWRCAQGHTWKARGGAVGRGNWCKQCYYDSMREDLAAMQALAHSKGGLCLSPRYIDAKTNLQWQCANGHVWSARPATIKISWCPMCSVDRKRLGIEKMHAMAAQRGGRCLSQTYTNLVTRMTWQCIEGHRWEARPAHIKRGQWCPECRLIHLATRRELTRLKKKPKVGIPVRL